MKAIGILRKAPKKTHNYIFNTDQEQLVEASRSDVVPGPMVKGNFKSPNPWSYTVTNQNYWHGEHFEHDLSGHLLAYFSGSFGTNNGIIPSDVISVAPTSGSVHNRCLEKLNRKTRGDLDLSVDAFQAKQNIRMVTGLRKAINYAAHPKNLLDDIRKAAENKEGRRYNEPVSNLFANGYLEWKYGWKPLADDIFGIADESIRHTINKIQRFKASVSQPFYVDLPVSRTVDGVANCTGVCKCRGKRTVTISVTLNVPSFDLARWATLNPVGIAWELIPYSFVVDWFYNVGGYLNQLETACLYDLRVVNGYESDLLVFDSETHLKNMSGFVSGSSKHTGQFTTDFQHRVFSRTVFTSYPLPRRPQLEVDLSSSQCYSAAALLRQTLERSFGMKQPRTPRSPKVMLYQGW